VPADASHRETTVCSVVLAGVVALAVAMGIGRFAFTPLLPLMLRDGVIDPAMAADWAIANYLGYLLGALSAARIGRPLLRGLRVGLCGVTACTILIGLGPQAPLAIALWFAAGLFSAWVLVTASGLYLAELVDREAGALGALIYLGVGTGIAVAGALAWLGGSQRALLLWLELGLLAAIGTAYVAMATPSRGVAARAPAVGCANTSSGHAKLVICYGAFGFGYIVPATFLPALAREQVDDPLVFGMTWPLFGLAAIISIAFVARFHSTTPRRRVWAAAQATMACGTALLVLSASLWSLVLSAILVGGTFMVTTMAGLQLARERAPLDPTPLLAKMTAAFAAGQIAGPVLVRVLALRPWGSSSTLGLASAAATVLLASTAVWLWSEEDGNSSTDCDSQRSRIG
jgi:MFS family permease